LCGNAVAGRTRSSVFGGGDHGAVPDLLLAPYLLVPNGVDVGPWTLVPFNALPASEVVPPSLVRAGGCGETLRLLILVPSPCLGSKPSAYSENSALLAIWGLSKIDEN
jgi:hypothetical protein